jgi:hypothetical protein
VAKNVPAKMAMAVVCMCSLLPTLSLVMARLRTAGLARVVQEQDENSNAAIIAAESDASFTFLPALVDTSIAKRQYMAAPATTRTSSTHAAASG